MYTKPRIILTDDMAEGVYVASGCYTATANIHQRPETGRGDYRIQINGKHDADHANETQWLHITFNNPVVYKGSGGTIEGAESGLTLTVRFNYHQNPTDNIGLGDLIVEADEGLAVVSVSITD